MKKTLTTSIIALGLAASFQVNAATGSGNGCGVWGKVSYLYQSASNTSLAIIDGFACFVSDTTARDVSVMSSILSEAEAGNKDALLEVRTSSVNVAMQP